MFKKFIIAFISTLKSPSTIYPAHALEESNVIYSRRYLENVYQSHKEHFIFGLKEGDIHLSKNTETTGQGEGEEHIEMVQQEYDSINHNIKTLQKKYPCETARLQKLALLEVSIKQYVTWQSNCESEFKSFLESEFNETTEDDKTVPQDSDIKKKLKSVQKKLRYYNNLLTIKSQLSSVSFERYTYPSFHLSIYSYSH